MNKRAIAVIGSGYWGRNLVRNFNELGALGLICDKNERVLNGLKEQFPETDVCLALNEVLSRPDIKGVVIAAPAEIHYTLAKEALLAGKHCLVEKPLTLNWTQAENLIDIAGRQGLVLMVGHLLHYHPGFVRLKELVAAGELGRINYIYSNRLNLGKIRREENILWSFAPHDVSMVLALAGEEPDSVSATGGNYLHDHIADVTTTHMVFSSGLQAHIFVSWLHPFKEQKLVVVGQKKMAVFDDTKPWSEKLVLYPHQINWQGQVPVAARANAEQVPLDEAEPLKNECRRFLDCIATGQTPLTDGPEGLRVLRVLNAAQQSMDQQGALINLTDFSASATKQAAYFAHPTAVIDDGAVIGEKTKIWHFSHVLPGSKIGRNASIGQNVVIGPDASVGDNCKIQNNVSVYKGVTLEDDVFCGPSMVFTNVHNPRAFISRMDELRPTLVRRGASLGANSTVVCGVTIGRYAFVGAGAVVTKNIPDHALVYGNPAEVMGWVCSCGVKLNREGDQWICPACGRTYREEDARPVAC